MVFPSLVLPLFPLQLETQKARITGPGKNNSLETAREKKGNSNSNNPDNTSIQREGDLRVKCSPSPGQRKTGRSDPLPTRIAPTGKEHLPSQKCESLPLPAPGKQEVGRGRRYQALARYSLREKEGKTQIFSVCYGLALADGNSFLSC